MIISTVGDYGGGDTPIPISNMVVKPFGVDGTWLFSLEE